MAMQFVDAVLASIAHGLLTELPAQLTTAALASAAASWRARRRRAAKEAVRVTANAHHMAEGAAEPSPETAD